MILTLIFIVPITFVAISDIKRYKTERLSLVNLGLADALLKLNFCEALMLSLGRHMKALVNLNLLFVANLNVAKFYP